jgi:ElaB/YqjD/DUF883 family membrane-anchored ribosome-binding protein
MGQDPSTGSPQVTETRDPEEIREEIESRRQELGETVAALAEKADVKAKAKDKVEDAKQSVRENPAPVAAAVVGVLALALVVRRARKR